jgi:hypothetical protein
VRGDGDKPEAAPNGFVPDGVVVGEGPAAGQRLSARGSSSESESSSSQTGKDCASTSYLRAWPSGLPAFLGVPGPPLAGAVAEETDRPRKRSKIECVRSSVMMFL